LPEQLLCERSSDQGIQTEIYQANVPDDLETNISFIQQALSITNSLVETVHHWQ
jgi:hypothetical protein